MAFRAIREFILRMFKRKRKNSLLTDFENQIDMIIKKNIK